MVEVACVAETMALDNGSAASVVEPGTHAA
jgi:hypothetical protein